MPLTDTISPSADNGVHSKALGVNFQYGKSVNPMVCLNRLEVSLVDSTTGGRRGS